MSQDAEFTLAYIGLGSNLNEPKLQLKRAIGALDQLPESRISNCSSFYLSTPVGPVEQPDFVNAVCALETTLSPQQLLQQLLQLEARAGRVRDGLRWGPRILDLDLLLFGQEIINEEDLVVPHPHLCQRAFVLIPFAEIAPETPIPARGLVKQCLAAVSPEGVTRLA